jgi:hypothetical protein
MAGSQWYLQTKLWSPRLWIPLEYRDLLVHLWYARFTWVAHTLFDRQNTPQALVPLYLTL